MDTLAFGYILPTTGRIPDLHRLETCAAGRTPISKEPPHQVALLCYGKCILYSLNRFRRVAFNRAQVEIHRVLGYLQQFCDMLHGIFHIKHTLLIEYFNNRAVV